MAIMSESSPLPWRATLADALALLPEGVGRRSAGLFTHGTLRVRLYAPRGFDPQEPHDQNEVYIIMSGQGTFRRGAETAPFAAGDVLFVPAQMAHRFEAFSDDFTAWVVFYGPPGGEAEDGRA
jgi:mannose-6-phosphate isomerase-like protein (cupin superfamily)